MAASFIKDPGSILDYTIDWDQGWLAGGETISTSVWKISPTGLTQDSEAETTTTATITVSGGTHAVSYYVTNVITTSAARTGERTIRITGFDNSM